MENKGELVGKSWRMRNGIRGLAKKMVTSGKEHLDRKTTKFFK
ncbi:MAG: hypothetical protein ONB37_12665 [candidate division KSB1 bacterium]|nr:hypothetical protein [candidate division KSB1 bacterium]